MARYRNRWSGVGHLGEDAKFFAFKEGGGRFRFRMATTRKFKVDGMPREDTQWHNVSYIVHSDAAKAFFENHLKKGTEVDVEGPLVYGSYTDKDGIERTSAEIEADSVQPMDPPHAKQGASQRPAATRTEPAQAATPSRTPPAAPPHSEEPAPTQW